MNEQYTEEEIKMVNKHKQRYLILVELKEYN